MMSYTGLAGERCTKLLALGFFIFVSKMIKSNSTQNTLSLFAV